MLSPQNLKLVLLTALFVVTLFFSLLPLKCFYRGSNFSSSNSSQIIISILSCFSAGVFLATCLLDLLPDTTVKINSALDRMGLVTSYPVAEFLLAIGFFLILFIEQCVIEFKGSHTHDNQSETVRNQDYRPVSQVDEDHSDGDLNSLNVNNEYIDNDNCDFNTAILPQNIVSSEAIDKSVPYQDPQSHAPLRTLILLIALSLHSLFEGLAVGLQTTSDQVLNIFVALSLHKCVLAFSIGMNLIQTKMNIKSIVLSSLSFSICSPLGMALGIVVDLLSKMSLSALFVQGILEGFACGTFIYIVFFEILPHEYNATNLHGNRLLKVLSLILGFAAVSLLLFLDPDVITTHRISD